MTALGSAMRSTPALALLWLFTQNLLTRGKMVLAAALTIICIILGVAIRQSTTAAPDVTSVEFVYFFGLALMVPVLSLVISSSVLGDLVEDESLVYIWMRPVSRATIAVTAWIASLFLTLPVTVIPLTVSVAIGSSNDFELMLATAGSVALAVIAYSGLFTLLGLLTKRALIVGLLYLFIWEFFVARVGGGAAKLSISTYPSAALVRWIPAETLERWRDVDPLSLEILEERSMEAAMIVPPAVALICVGLTALRLARSRIS